MRRLFLCLMLAGCLAVPSAAGAVYEPLSSGKTKLVFDKAFLGLLAKHGVKLQAVAGATLSAGKATLPVVAGKIDPTRGVGTIEHEGTLRLLAGKKSIPLRAWQLKTTQKRSPFTAKVGGSQLKVATAEEMKVTRAGFAERVAVTKLALSAKLATRLSKKLRLRGVFEAGQPLGSASTTAVPATVGVKQSGRASFTLTPAFAAKLDSLFVAVNPISPAERPGPGAFTFPIASGQLAPSASTGTVQLGGSVEFLQLGAGQIFWAEPLLDLGTATASAEADLQPSPPYRGKIGRVPLASLGLGSATISSNSKARRITVENATLSFDAQMAAAFNEAFSPKNPVFAGGEAIGTVSFAATGQ